MRSSVLTFAGFIFHLTLKVSLQKLDFDVKLFMIDQKFDVITEDYQTYRRVYQRVK